MNNWLVVCSKPSQETRAEVNLRRQFGLVYCPRIYVRGTTKPLFPSYLFVKPVNGEPIHAIMNTFGVRNLVKIGLEPATLSDSAINEIKARESTAGIVKLCPFKPGDVLEWSRWGDQIPLIYQDMVDDDRCMVLFSMLGRSNYKILRTDELSLAGAN